LGVLCQALVPISATPGHVVCVSDNFQLAGETADIDDVLVTDTANPPVPVAPVTWSRVKSLLN